MITGDGDTGPNGFQNYPVLDTLKIDLGNKSVYVGGHLTSTPNSDYTLQFFANKVGDNTGYGEGQKYLGSAKVSTGSTGTALFGQTFAFYSSWGDVISATATDSQGNTSEFSQNIGGLQNQIIASNSWPFVYKTNADGILRITNGSDIIAVDSSFRTWNMVSTAKINFSNGGTTTAKYASATDKTNLVTFTDDRFPFSPGILAVAAKTLRVVPGTDVAQIIDADIVVNPDYARNDVGVGYNNTNSGYFDAQSVITHEIGHVLGLLHSGVANSTMFYAMDEGIKLRSLEQDDKSWASYRYQGTTYNGTFGSISGNIIYGYDELLTEPVAGALVLAINTSTRDTVHAYSDASGHYVVPGLRPGTYNLYVEPLDGSTNVHKLKPANISSYIYCNTIYTDYPGEFCSDPETNIELSETPKSVGVSAGAETTGVNIITNKDIAGPEVVSISPVNNSENFDVKRDVIVTFSEPIDEKTLTDETCYLESGGIKHGVKYPAIGNDSRVILLAPDSALKYLTKYTLHLTAGVKDLRGNVLLLLSGNPDYQSSFTTMEADLTPPEITDTYPLNEADSVFVMEKITLFFSEPMNKTSVENNFTLTYPDDLTADIKKVDGSFTWDRENKSVTYIPLRTLTEGTEYTINVLNGASDLGGVPMTENKSYTFKTIPNAAPEIIYLGPSDLETGVTVSTPIVVDFSEPIDVKTINSTTFNLSLNGNLVTGTYELLNENSRVVLRPDANLEFLKTYKITITTGIKDVSDPSLPLEANKAATFTTEAQQNKTVHINYLEPPAGVIGSVVIIEGKGFDPNPLKNTIKFNGISAVVKSATLTTLTTEVPLGAISGSVDVTGINGLASDNSMSFYVIPQSYDPCESVTANTSTKSTSSGGTDVVGDALAFVTNPLANTVTVVYLKPVSNPPDPSNPSIAAIIPVGEMPMKIDINPQGTLAYVTNFNSNDISVIDVRNMVVVDNIKVGKQPYGIAVTPDGKRVYVANYFSENLSLIDTDPNSGGFDHVVANVNTGTKTSDVAVTADATMVLVTGDFGLKIINANPKDENYNSVIANVASGTKTKEVDVTPDAGLAFVTTEDNNILVINLHPETGNYSDAVVANVPAGTKITDVKVSGDAMFVYVAAPDLNKVLVYKLGYGGSGTANGSSSGNLSLIPHSSIDVGYVPDALVVNPSATNLYIVDGTSGGIRQVTTITLCCGPVDPTMLIGDLITTVQNMINNGSITKVRGYALIILLNNSLKNINAGRTKLAILDLTAFNALIKTYNKNKQISTNQANALINAANAIIAQLKGTKSDEAAPASDYTEVITKQDIVSESKLGIIYPNPFSESVVINYEVAADDPGIAKVLIRIYDISGRLIGTLVNMNMQFGRYTVSWDGKDINGEQAPHGTYIVHFKAGDKEEVKEVVLVK